MCYLYFLPYQISFSTLLCFTKPLVLILQHTVTTELDSVQKNIQKTLDAIKELNIQTILIHGNADAGSKKISEIIKIQEESSSSSKSTTVEQSILEKISK